MLKLLLPALEAGVSTRVQLAVRARALEKAFDAAGYGIAIHGPDARRVYANRAFSRLVDADPQRERLLRGVKAGVEAIAGFVLSDGAVRPEELGEASREILTTRGRYRLRLNLIGEGLFTAQPSILATLEPTTPRRPSVPELRGRWGLTRQEARVALLLADGRTNRQIAETMELRPATTRHYTEAVFLKLGVHSRAEAAAKVLTG